MVYEYEHQEFPVAVKIGRPFKPIDEGHEFARVQRELKIFEVLAELQGDVIPQVIAGVYDEMCVADGMLLMTEKVRFELEESIRD